jgi:hypothetical protein
MLVSKHSFEIRASCQARIQRKGHHRDSDAQNHNKYVSKGEFGGMLLKFTEEVRASLNERDQNPPLNEGFSHHYGRP